MPILWLNLCYLRPEYYCHPVEFLCKVCPRANGIAVLIVDPGAEKNRSQVFSDLLVGLVSMNPGVYRANKWGWEIADSRVGLPVYTLIAD